VDQGIGSWIRARAMRRGGDVALVDGAHQTRYTYAQLDTRIDRLASALHAEGIRSGDRVALLAANSAAFFEIVFAVARCGAILVPINFRLSGQEIGYILADSGAVLLFATPQFETLAREALQHAPSHRLRQTLNAEDAALHDFAQRGATDRFSGAQVALDHICMIMYTSGTTGQPKGAMLTHGNMLWNAINMCGSPEGLLRTDATLAVAPLFHIGAMGIFSLPLLYLGGKVVTVDHFDPQQTLALMRAERVTVQFLVPTMWAALRDCPDMHDFDACAIRWSMSGGSPCPMPLLEFFGQRGWRLCDGYGLTETAPVCTIADPDRIRDKPASIGLPLRHVVCRVADDADCTLPVGEIGELLVRGPHIFKGYWGLARETAKALAGGWFHTGDLAISDAEGFITLVDRKKDMIISGGENVYPAEVERQLMQHPDVAEAAVIGIPDTRWGETVLALVCPRADAVLDSEALIVWMRERLAHYKCPRRVEFVKTLPRNATGKLLKRTLREQYAGTPHEQPR